MQKPKTKYIVLFLTLGVIVVFLLALLAMANYHNRVVYETRYVNMIADVETDGTLRITDQRVVSIFKDAQNIQVPVSKTTDKSFVQVSSVRIIDPDEVEEGGESRIYTLNRNTLNAEELKKLRFNPQEKLSGDMTYFFDRESSSIFLSVGNCLESDKNYVLSISYNIQDSVYVYDDMAEIYWDWIPNWTNSKIENATILMQVPTSPSLLPEIGENIWAWDHGNNGEIDYAGEAAFRVSTSNLHNGQGSRIHLLFTKYWMSNIARGSEMVESGARRDLALSEETKWGDGDNTKIKNTYILNLSLLVVSATILLYVTISYWQKVLKFRRLTSLDNKAVTYLNQASFDESAYRQQIVYLILCAICFLGSIIGFAVMRAYIGSACLIVASMVCIGLCSATPTIHTSFRDKI